MTAAIENKESYDNDVFKASHLAKATWGKVNKETIVNCLALKLRKNMKKNQIQLQPRILKSNPQHQQDRQIPRLR